MENEENKEIPCSCALYASYADTVGCCSRNSDSTGSRAQTVKVKLDKKTGKRYGYDENNQKVTQQWGVTAKGFRYYFGKNGAAYQADQDMVGKYGILMKKINGKYYGFDVSGHTVKGIRVGSVSMYDIPKLYYFNPKTGAVDKKKTSLYRKYAATSTLAKQNNASKIKKVLENIKSVQ